MAKYLINRLDLGKRTIGYKIYVSETKEIYGLTERQIKKLLDDGDRIYGFITDSGGNLKLDQEGFHTRNIMIESGIGKLRPFILSGIASVYYVVVAVHMNQEDMAYEVVSSRYGRTCISENRLIQLFGVSSITGGVYLDSTGKPVVCEGVEVIEEDQ